MTAGSRGSAGTLLAGLALCRGSAYGFTKLALVGLSPGNIVFLRLGFGSVVLVLALAATLRDLEWIRYDWRGAVVHAIVGNILPIGLITLGQQSVPSGLAAVLMALTPLFSAVLAHVCLPNERLSARSVLGLALGFSGVLAIVLLRGELRLASGMSAGLAALTVAAMCFAAQVVFARAWSPRNQVGTSALSLLIATIAALPFIEVRGILAVANGGALAASVALGVVCTAFAMLAMLMLAQRAEAAFAATVNYLIPLVGLGVAAAFFGEPVFWGDICAIALIVTGTALVQSRQPASPAPLCKDAGGNKP